MTRVFPPLNSAAGFPALSRCVLRWKSQETPLCSLNPVSCITQLSSPALPSHNPDQTKHCLQALVFLLKWEIPRSVVKTTSFCEKIYHSHMFQSSISSGPSLELWVNTLFPSFAPWRKHLVPHGTTSHGQLLLLSKKIVALKFLFCCCRNISLSCTLFCLENSKLKFS